MSWSKEIPLEWDLIQIPTYPDGAIIDVEFKCGECGRKLLAEGLDIPRFGFGDTESETRRWGDTVTVECECGATFDVVADNSIAGWDVNIEGESGREKLPKTFRYKVYEDLGEPPEEDL